MHFARFAPENPGKINQFSKEVSMALKVGKLAPDFSLKSHLGPPVRLSEFYRKCNVVLAFFPLAWTPI
jgi:hypothetical protein